MQRSTPTRPPVTDDAPRLAAEAHAGFPERPGSPRVVRARAAFARAIWGKSGARRLPAGSELDRALLQLPPAELSWMCEFAPLGPLYLLPTRPFAKALARTLEELGARRVLEVAAGDGFLARALRQVNPRLEVVATDSGAWSRPSARMTRRELRSLRGVAVPGVRAGADVLRVDARRAIRKVAPDLVLCSWLPPGHMLDGLVRAPVRHVLEIGAGSGVTASAWSWRFQHEFLEGALERHARCRLDARPDHTRHSKITLYFGAAHPDFHEERVRRGDWLWQYRPER